MTFFQKGEAFFKSIVVIYNNLMQKPASLLQTLPWDLNYELKAFISDKRFEVLSL